MSSGKTLKFFFIIGRISCYESCFCRIFMEAVDENTSSEVLYCNTEKDKYRLNLRTAGQTCLQGL